MGKKCMLCSVADLQESIRSTTAAVDARFERDAATIDRLRIALQAMLAERSKLTEWWTVDFSGRRAVTDNLCRQARRVLGQPEDAIVAK